MTTPTLISNVRLDLLRPSTAGDAVVDLLCEGGRIGTIASGIQAGTVREFDGTGLSIAAGLIDLQVNGAWGHDLTSDPESVWAVGSRLASVGVTGWLPTLVSATPETMDAALRVTAQGPPDRWKGAVPIGWHFEGPWLNPDRRGAHRLESIRAPRAGLAQAQQAKLVTLAPEMPGSIGFIIELVDSGVAVSLGHTAATAAQTRAGLDAGARMGTHLFNAMTGLSHRDPGAAAALLDDERAWLGLIVDHEHVAAELVRIAWTVAQDRVVLVSDSMAATGLPEGAATLSHKHVVVANGTARLEDGTLAGSVITLLEGVANLISTVGCHPSAALLAASHNPARALGLSDVGCINVGHKADFVLFGPDLSVQATFVAGELVYLGPEQEEAERWK